MDLSGITSAFLLAATPVQETPAVTPVDPIPQTSQQSPAPTEGETRTDVVVTARDTRGDPAAPLNTAVLDVAEGLDKALVGPVALAYERNVPDPVRSGLRNFLTNLREPVVFINFLLQGKFGKAGETAGRFVLNSTIGVVGLFDMAKRRPFRLPLRRNSFANTLGFYGVGPGPFFFLPLIGPTTVRDLLGNVADQVLIPVQPIRVSGSLAYTLPVGVLSALDYRARIEPDLQRQRGSGDPYTALRRDYLARRQAEIDGLRGRKANLPRADALR